MWWDETIRAIGVGRLEEPGMMGNWSAKDLIAHVTGWQWKTLQSMEASLAGVDYPATPWPQELNDPGSWVADGNTEAINQWIHENVASHSAEDVIAQSRQQWDTLQTLVSRLTADQMRDPRFFAWTGGRPLVDVIESGDFFQHFREHRQADIDPWIEKNGKML